jgi:hypothetical protein
MKLTRIYLKIHKSVQCSKYSTSFIETSTLTLLGLIKAVCSEIYIQQLDAFYGRGGDVEIVRIKPDDSGGT